MTLLLTFILKTYRNIIASAGADSLVKIWDVVAEKCDITMGHHSNMARIKIESE